MAKKRIFISFDFETDRQYRYLLLALAKNKSSDIEFDDRTPDEIKSSNISRVKAVLTRKIREATHTLVIIGKYANSYHPDRVEIGTRNWQWWEIEQSISEDKDFIAVKIDTSYNSPSPLYGQNTKWAFSFTVPAILKAIEDA